MINPRCFELFQMACSSERTRETYTQLLDLFLKWANKDYESLLVLTDSELQILLEDYMMYCKKRYARAGIRGRFASIEKFLFVNDRIVNKKKLLMFLPEKLKTKQRSITTDEIRLMLNYCGSKRNLAIVHVFSAMGIRPEALADLRIRDIEEMPDGYTSVIVYAGSNNELQSFYHSEVTKAVNDYLDERKQEGELLKPESWLFRQKSFFSNSIGITPLSVNGIESIISNIMKHAGIKRIKMNENRYDLPVCGGFRNRFNTIFKSNSDIPYVIGEMFSDHKIRMEPSYMFPSKEKLFEEYKKAVPELIIDEKERLKQEIKQNKKEAESSKGMKREIADMNKRFDGIEDILKKLSEKD
ncbi:MAG: site-specific integrase [Thaumarchaeota archaeon]|nr:site-specific integrase [Nitrososphaerota archaeon]